MHERLSRATKAFRTVCETMAVLRGPGGCPWDAKQTLKTLQPYLIEEAFEAVDAAEQSDARALCEELGDVLLQIVFQCEVAQETGLFDLADVASALDAKLKRRHPDIFAAPASQAQDGQTAVRPETAEAALQRWEAIKAMERPRHKGCLSGVPRSMPSLLRAWRTLEKAAAAGFEWPLQGARLDNASKQFGALREAIEAPDRDTDKDRTAAAMGDVLFSLVSACQRLEIDPEGALRATTNRFHRRFEHMEHQLKTSGRQLQDTPLGALEALWEQAQAPTESKPATSET